MGEEGRGRCTIGPAGSPTMEETGVSDPLSTVESLVDTPSVAWRFAVTVRSGRPSVSILGKSNFDLRFLSQCGRTLTYL